MAESVRLQSVVLSTPLRTPYGLQFDVDAESIEIRNSERGNVNRSLSGKIRLRLEASEDPAAWADVEALHLQSGDTIRALVQLHRPRIYQNPGSFDFRRWMESIEDLYWVGTIKNPLLVEKLQGANRPSLSRFVETIRHRLIDAIDALYPPWASQMRDGAVLKAVLLGERASLDSDTIENFRRTGLYHLLVIAGLHIGLLALIAGFLLRLLPISESWRSGLLFVFILLYASLVERRAPTLRATLMICAYLIARQLYREHAALNAIGLAALLLLLQRPAWLLESGFELSFSAALLIGGLAVPILMRTTEPYRRALSRIDDARRDVVYQPRAAQFRIDLRDLIIKLKSRLGFMRRHPAIASGAVTLPTRLAVWTANALVFSAVLQLGLLLPMAIIFHRVTLSGIGLNALAIPAMVLLLAIALPTVLLAVVSPALAAWPAKLVHLILTGLFALTNLPGMPHWLSFRVAEPPAWVAWGFVISTLIAALALGRSRRVFWIALVGHSVFATLVSLHPFAPRLPHGVVEVTALDCGGGDATLIVLPDQTTLLMDAGGAPTRTSREGAFLGRRWDPGEDVVSPYLWSRGIERINVVMVSRAHEDHLVGLASVVRNFNVGEFWYGVNRASPSFQDLLEQVRRREIPIREMAAGDRVDRGSSSVLTLWPPQGGNSDVSARSSTIDDSLVVRISSGVSSVLLPGDISGKTEQVILSSGFPLESRVLKVAHQGSKNSSTSEFLDHVSPQVALVSAESGGRYNLPSPETLGRIRAAGARVYRTDLNGAVTITMRAGSVSVHTYGTSPAD